MEFSCRKCDKNFKKETPLICSGFCNKAIHRSCAEFSKYDVDVLNAKANIFYLCDECIDFIKILNENHIKLIKTIKENQENLLNMMEVNMKQISDKVSEIKNVCKPVMIASANREVHNEKETYASKVKKGPQVILKPKSIQESAITREEIKKNINPSSLSINVSSVSNRRDGAIAIECGNDESSVKMQNAIKEKMSEKYDIQIPEMRNPKVRVCGMSEMMSSDVIIESIQAQNKIVFKVIKCIKVYQSPKNKKMFNAILEVDGGAFQELLCAKRINIQWDRCVIYEEINVKRCFKCWGFNHNAKKCTGEETCVKCAGNHSNKNDCDSENTKCVSCIRANNTLHLNVDVNHDTRSSKCPVLQRKMQSEMQKIAY